jgi:hypothetical protein
MIIRSIYSNDQKKKNTRQTMLEKILYRKCFNRQTTYSQANNIMYAFFISNKTNGAGTVYPSGTPEFTPGFSGVRYTRSLVVYVCVVDRCLSFYTFSLGHCVVCSSLVYEFWLPIRYLQTLSIYMTHSVSRRLNLLCKMFKIIAIFIMKLFNQLYLKVNILLTRDTHSRDSII